MMTTRSFWTVLALSVAGAACGGASGDAGAGLPGGGGPGARGPRGGAGGDRGAAAVPVEVATAARRAISSYIETNGRLEAENEVDLVARTAGPIVELAAEEGMLVRKGQLLARIDPVESRAQVEIAKVQLEESQRAYDRGKESWEAELISEEAFEQLLAARDAAEAELHGRQIVLDYTRITAPFDAIVVERAIKHAENVTANQRLFRISDFDPLLCRIQIPERELGRLRLGQSAQLTVEAWPGERFPAKVLRISPVVDAATGTIRVTLEVEARRKLRPGMFASVFLEVDRREDALAIPKTALSLESLGDTVYVVDGELAARRPVELGYEDTDAVEVVSGLREGEQVIVVGQDGLSDGTPVRILAGPGAEPPAAADARVAEDAPREGPPPNRTGPAEGRAGSDPSQMSPEQLEQVKQRMRDRGLSDAEIEARLKERRSQR